MNKKYRKGFAITLRRSSAVEKCSLESKPIGESRDCSRGGPFHSNALPAEEFYADCRQKIQ